MSRRGWVLGLAFTGCVIVLGMAFGSWLHEKGKPPPQFAGFSYADRAQADNQKSRGAKIPRDALNWITGEKRNAQQPRSDSERAQESQVPNPHDAFDLEAQWAAANAAESMVRLTIVQIIIGVAGIIFIVVSLRLNRDAIKSATRAAIASEEAVKVASDTAQQELRAYVHMEMNPTDVLSVIKGQSLIYFFTVKNIGKTPAHDVCANGRIVIESPSYMGGALEQPFGRPTESVLFPDQEVFPKFTRVPVVTSKEIADLSGGSARVHVIGQITYKDVFSKPGDEPRITKFRLISEPNRLPAKLMYNPEGNTAT